MPHEEEHKHGLAHDGGGPEDNDNLLLMQMTEKGCQILTFTRTGHSSDIPKASLP
jgi:hypothetical protein